MNYVSNNFLNNLIDKTITSHKKFLSKRKSVIERQSLLEARHNSIPGLYYPKQPDNLNEEFFRQASWAYIKGLLAGTLIFGAIFLAITYGVIDFTSDTYQRSNAESALWGAVKANNHPANVVSPAGIGATMPCKATKLNDNADTSIFTGATFTCNTLSTSYSTSSMSTDLVKYAYSSPTALAASLNPTITYSFEVDTMRSGVNPQPYLTNCVSSTQDINNASDNPGEVMNVIENQTEPLQTFLGPNLIWSVCEWAGTQGTVDLTAETVQNNTIIQLSALTDTSYDSGLFNKFFKYMVTVRYE
jgi:hypothetical protein